MNPRTSLRTRQSRWTLSRSWRMGLLAASLSALGLLAGAYGVNGMERATGGLLTLGGGGILAWDRYRLYREMLTRRKALREAEARLQVRRARQKRKANAREEMRRERETQTRARRSHQEAEAQRREAERQAMALVLQAREARRQALEDQVARLRRLSLPDLVAQVAAIFAYEGKEAQDEKRVAQPEGEDTECDLMVTFLRSGRKEVVRCLPSGQSAHASDIRALRAWRTAVGAEKAYLIAPDDFAPEAVVEAGNDIRMIDAYSLAQWKPSPPILSPTAWERGQERPAPHAVGE